MKISSVLYCLELLIVYPVIFLIDRIPLILSGICCIIEGFLTSRESARNNHQRVIVVESPKPRYNKVSVKSTPKIEPRVKKEAKIDH